MKQIAALNLRIVIQRIGLVKDGIRTLEKRVEGIVHQLGQTVAAVLFAIRAADEVPIARAVVAVERQMRAAVCRVIHLHQDVGGKLALDPDIPLVNFRIAQPIVEVVSVVESPLRKLAVLRSGRADEADREWIRSSRDETLPGQIAATRG